MKPRSRPNVRHRVCDKSTVSGLQVKVETGGTYKHIGTSSETKSHVVPRYPQITPVSLQAAAPVHCNVTKKRSQTSCERQRRYRERLKENPERLEERKKKDRERWQARVKEGKIKRIMDLTPEEQSAQRQYWRVLQKRLRNRNASRDDNTLTMSGSPHGHMNVDQNPSTTKSVLQDVDKNNRTFGLSHEIDFEPDLDQRAKHSKIHSQNVPVTCQVCSVDGKLLTSRYPIRTRPPVLRKSTLSSAERQRRFRERLKNDPMRLEEHRKKGRERWHSGVESGRIKRVKDLTVQQLTSKRKYWQSIQRNSRIRKQTIRQTTLYLEEVQDIKLEPASFPDGQSLICDPIPETHRDTTLEDLLVSSWSDIPSPTLTPPNAYAQLKRLSPDGLANDLMTQEENINDLGKHLPVELPRENVQYSGGAKYNRFNMFKVQSASHVTFPAAELDSNTKGESINHKNHLPMTWNASSVVAGLLVGSKENVDCLQVIQSVGIDPSYCEPDKNKPERRVTRKNRIGCTRTVHDDK